MSFGGVGAPLGILRWLRRGQLGIFVYFADYFDLGLFV